MLKCSEFIPNPFCFLGTNKSLLNTRYLIQQKKNSFFSLKQTESLGRGQRKDLFSYPWGDLSGSTAWNVCSGCVTVTNSRGSVPRQVSYSPFDKQGEELPGNWQHSFRGRWVHVAALSVVRPLSHTLCSALFMPPSSQLCQLLYPFGSREAATPYLLLGFSTGCRWISAPPWTSMGFKGVSSHAGAPTPAPFSLIWVSAELFFSHILIPFSMCSHFLYYHCCWWAQTWPASWSWIAQTPLDMGEKLLAASPRSHPYSLPSTRTCPHKHNTQHHAELSSAISRNQETINKKPQIVT